jgi:hypothetical protein
MKNLFSILIICFLVISCSTVAPTTKVIQVSHDIKVLSTAPDNYSGGGTIIDIDPNKVIEWKTIVTESYDDLNVGADAYRGEAINIETGKKFHIGNYPYGFFRNNVYTLERTLIDNCERLYKSKCFVSRTSTDRFGNDVIYFTDPEDYKQKTEQKRLAEIQKREEEIIAIQKRKQDAFNKLYETCLSFGFSEQNEIAKCIQQEVFNEKKLAILKEQQLQQLALLNNQQTSQNQSFWDEVLEGLADPNTWENARQNAEIQRLKNQQRRTIPKICSGTSCN